MEEGGCGVMCGRLSGSLRTSGVTAEGKEWRGGREGGLGGGVDMQALAAALINQTGCDAS